MDLTTTPQDTPKPKRIVYFDILRVIACCSVIMIHTSASYVVTDFGSFNFWVGNIFDSFSRIAIPIFVMLSGALMLDEKYVCTPKKIFSHILKMVIFFIFWSTFYCVAHIIIVPILNHENISIKNVLKNLMIGPLHLWFCFMIIGLYLIVPLLRLWVKKENKKHVEYFIILSLIFCFFIPQIISIGGLYFNAFYDANIILNYFNLKYVAGFTTYFILGWYLNNFEIKHKKILYILGFLGVLFTIVVTYILSYTKNTAIQAYDNLSLNVLFPSIVVFIFVKNKFYKTESDTKFTRSIQFVAKHSLGIYAIHSIMIELCYKIINQLNITLSLITIPLIFTVVFFTSLLISFVMSKIPLLKKVV